MAIAAVNKSASLILLFEKNELKELCKVDKLNYFCDRADMILEMNGSKWPA